MGGGSLEPGRGRSVGGGAYEHWNIVDPGPFYLFFGDAGAVQHEDSVGSVAARHGSAFSTEHGI